MSPESKKTNKKNSGDGENIQTVKIVPNIFRHLYVKYRPTFASKCHQIVPQDTTFSQIFRKLN